MMGVLVDLYASPRLLPLAVLRGYAFSRLHNTAGSSRKYPRCCLSIAAANYESFTTRAPRLSVESMLLNLLRRHLFMGLTASALSSSAPAAKGAIRYRQLWVSADGVTHIDEQECGKLETKDFTSTGGDAALQYVRAFSNSDDFALTGLVVTQQVGENPWHYCPSPQFVVTLEGSWYIRTSDGKTTTFKPGDVRLSASIRHAIDARMPTPPPRAGLISGQLRGAPTGQTRSERPSPERRPALERRQRRPMQPARARREAPRLSRAEARNLVSICFITS